MVIAKVASWARGDSSLPGVHCQEYGSKEVETKWGHWLEGDGVAV